MGPISISAIAAGTSAVITALGLALAWHAKRREERLSIFGLKAEWCRDVREWASKSIGELAEAVYRYGNPESGISLFKCRHQLSAAVETGRFLFPNVMREEYGQEKLPAYRGYRHSILDPLVASIKILEGDCGTFESHISALKQMRRHFVSEVSEILRVVVKSNEDIEKLIEANSLKRKNGEAQADTVEEIPGGHLALLYLEDSKDIAQ